MLRIISSYHFFMPAACLILSPFHHCFSAGSSDHSLCVWDVHTRIIIACLTGHTCPIASVCFSPSSVRIAAASSDGSIRLWSSLSGAGVVTLVGHTSTATCCLTWSIDEALVAAGGDNGCVSVWETVTGLKRAVLWSFKAAAVTRILLSPDARLLAAAVDGAASCVYVFDLSSSSLLASPSLKGCVNRLQWSADGRVLKDDLGDVFSAP